MTLDEYDLQRYLHADTIIRKLNEKLTLEDQRLYNCSLCVSVVFDDSGVHLVSPNIERLVANSVSVSDSIHQRIQMWEMRRKLFLRWFGSLSREERSQLSRHDGDAPQCLKDEAQAELYEINTYVAFHFGYDPPSEQIDLSDDPISNINAMADWLEE